ncbi:MAG: hypothetical protein ACKOAD_06830 [Gammaproteobacteria bacterium]
MNQGADSFQMLLFRAIRHDGKDEGGEARPALALPQEEQTQEAVIRNSSSLS